VVERGRTWNSSFSGTKRYLRIKRKEPEARLQGSAPSASAFLYLVNVNVFCKEETNEEENPTELRRISHTTSREEEEMTIPIC